MLLDVNERPRAGGGRAARWALLGLYGSIFAGLTWAWRDPALRHWLDPHVLSQLGRQLLASPFGPLAVMGGYVVAVSLAMPVAVLITVGSLIFGPWPGMMYALLGMLCGAVVTYGLGRLTGARVVDGWTEGRLATLAQRLKAKGLATVIFVRVVPVAPFLVVNLAAGALRVRFSHFVLGSFLGLLPGTILISLFADRLRMAWTSPGWGSYAGLAGCLLAIVAASWWARRRLSRPPSAG